jgi:hypothetical protein
MLFKIYLLVLVNLCFFAKGARYLTDDYNDLNSQTNLAIGILESKICVYMKFNDGRILRSTEYMCTKDGWGTCKSSENTAVSHNFNDIGYARKIWNVLPQFINIRNKQKSDDCIGQWYETHILGDISFGSNNIDNIKFKEVVIYIEKLFNFKESNLTFNNNEINELKKKL